ncbi:hypothetical protein IAD21_04346 [Abditibacteriota bacterium]|nr:hypothetical protein IAD21_04346 [Abditibacteriota bacterium]
MEAVILAGGPIPLSLQGATSAPERALIPLEGRPLIDHVLESLRGVPPVTGIICVAPPHTLAHLPSDVRGLESGDKLSENLFKGARAAQSDRILIVTGDVPLATGRTWMQFIDGAAVNLIEAAYPIVSRANCEEQFPGGTRTYAPLKDGQFTGGNAFLMPREHLESLESMISQAFAARKNPFALARMLGAGFIAKALAKRLTIHEVEVKISKMIGCRAGAVPIPDAAIAFDIDKQDDLDTAARVLRERGKNTELDPCGPAPLQPNTEPRQKR